LRVILVLLCLVGVARAEVRVERGYKNGRPTRIRVVTIGWTEVEIQTARAFRKMEAAAEKDGVTLYIRSGFRSNQRQRELYRAWREGWGNKAARPGYSNHQSGCALDISMDEDVAEWMSVHAKKFGFRQTVRGEPWHWEYKPVRGKTLRARATSARRR
jgi:LAS superfamily LD-carboxypeptidase LdcB